MFRDMKKSLVLRITLLFMFFILVFMTLSHADTELLDYEINVDVHNDGSMHVQEIWKVEADEISTLFKTFRKSEGYSTIENVTVKEITNGTNSVYTQTNEYKYRQDEGRFHALFNPDGEFEIAWGAKMHGNTRSFVVEYDVYDVVTKYNDCEDFYWKIVGETFEAPINHLHGKVTIPPGIENMDDFRIWAHGTLNGTIEKISTNELKYSVDYNKPKSFVEIRITTPVGIFMEGVKASNTNKLDSILAEEQKNADEANKKREQLAKTQKMQMIGGNVGACILGAIFLFSFPKRREFLSTHPKLNPEIDYDYFRDIPDKMLSGFDACAIGEIAGETSQKMSSLLMSLTLKKYISFDILSKNKKDMYIIIEPSGNNKNELNTHERLMLNYLQDVDSSGRFSLKDFERYGQRHISKVDRLLDKLSEVTEECMKSYGIIDKERKEKTESSIGLLTFGIIIILVLSGVLIGFGSFIGLAVLGVLGLVWIIDVSIFISKVGKRTQKGIDEKSKWQGLKKFMEEFSMLDKREVPELALWEEYLVYATAFGVADKVIKQLKVIYPELSDTQYIANNYSVLNMASNDSFGKSFSNSLASSIGSVTNLSSGSGGGGGFSGGGGGGGGRRWRRWSLIINK